MRKKRKAKKAPKKKGHKPQEPALDQEERRALYAT